MGTKAPPARSDCSCYERANNSLPVPLSPVIRTVAFELEMVLTKRRNACAMGLVPMKNACCFMLDPLSLMGCSRQAVKSIRPSMQLDLKKLGQWSILRMYPMKQVCLDEPVANVSN